MSEKRNGKELDFLKDYPTTILESAIALITGTHHGIHVTLPGIKRQTSKTERLGGYAVTALFSTDTDDERGRKENTDYWNYVFQQASPKIAISVDASKVPASGSSWGQLNAHIHKALGCRGVITNGGVRDIEEFERIGFQVFSSHLTVGHGNPHFINYGQPVTLQGVTFRSGDIVCVDEHGAIVVPQEFLQHIGEAVEEVKRRVGLVTQYCASPDFTPAGLAETIKRTKSATAWKPTAKSKLSN